MQGLAVDFTVPRFGTVLQTARAVAASGIAFNQVIPRVRQLGPPRAGADGQPPAGEKLSIFTGTGYLERPGGPAPPRLKLSCPLEINMLKQLLRCATLALLARGHRGCRPSRPKGLT